MSSGMKAYIVNFYLFLMIVPNTLILFNRTLFDLYNNYSIFITLFFVIMLLVFNPKNLKVKEFIFILFSSIFMFMNTVINTKLYGSALMLLLSIVIIIVISKIQIKKELYWTLYILMTSFNLFLFIKSLIYIDTGFVDFNTNQLAMNMFLSYMFVIVLSRYLKPNKFVEFICFLLTVIGINNYDSRTTFVSFIFFVVFFYLVPRKLLLRKNIFRSFYTIILLSTVMLPYLYTYIWKNSMQFTVQIMGKRFFTGREQMWSQLFDSLDSLSDLLFGLGHRMSFSNGLINAHNASLHIIMTNGLIACILYYLLIIYKFELLIKKEFRISSFGFECLISFLAMIIYTYFENPLQPTRMVFIYLFLAIYTKELNNTVHESIIILNSKH